MNEIRLRLRERDRTILLEALSSYFNYLISKGPKNHGKAIESFNLAWTIAWPKRGAREDHYHGLQQNISVTESKLSTLPSSHQKKLQQMIAETRDPSIRQRREAAGRELLKLPIEKRAELFRSLVRSKYASIHAGRS